MSSVTKVLMVVVLMMAFAGVGCGGTFSSPGKGALALVPSGATQIEQWDVTELLNEEGPLVKGFEDRWEGILEEVGIFVDDLDTLTGVWSSDGEITIVEGDLDFEDIRDALHDGEFDERTWRGYELWEGSSYSGIKAMTFLEDEGRVVLGSTSEGVREVLKSIDRETGFLSSDEKSAQDMRRAWEKAGSGLLRESWQECRVEADIRGCQATAWAVNFPADNGTSVLEVAAVFLFRNERTAQSQAKRMAEFYQEAIDSNPSWSPPVSLPTGDARLSIDISDPEVDGDFATFLVTFTVNEEASLDDGREQASSSMDGADSETPASISPVLKVTPSIAVPS